MLLDAQATVSADRKYVTLTMRPQNSALVALRDFTFQNGVNGQAFGFVGFPPPPAPPAKNAAPSRNARSRAAPPAAPVAAVNPAVLAREGMTRVDAPGR